MLQRAHRTDRRKAAWVALTAVIGVIALTVSSLGSTADASTVKVDSHLFGMHDASDTSLGHGVRSVRLWDTGTTWRDLDAGKDKSGHTVYDFDHLDTLVSQARSHGAEVTLVLGVTPSRFSKDPTKLPASHIGDYKAYVRAVMNRYGSRISAYQAWNEPNVVDYWTGSVSEMAQLTKIVWDARKATHISSLVVSPSLTTRLTSQRKWIKAYAATSVGGRSTSSYVDVVGLNLYPLASYGRRTGVPEDSMTLLRQTKDILAVKGWSSKPIWDTEINYGLRGGTTHGAAASISESRQVANVLRTYVLNAAANVKRVFWYRWDMTKLSKGGGKLDRTLGNTLLSEPGKPATLTKGGRAFVLAQSWLKGRLVGSTPGAKPCGTDKSGTYTCTLRTSSGVSRIYWNPFKSAHVKVAGSAKTQQNQFGTTTRIKGGATLKVSYQPILVRSKK